MISVRQWSVKTRVGEDEKTILLPTSFELRLGAILGVYGPNGSGKTTLLKSISGVSAAEKIKSGEFWIETTSKIPSLPPHERIKHIVYLGSDFAPAFEITVQELLELVATATSEDFWPTLTSAAKARIDLVVELLQIAPFLRRSIQTLSDGEKQIVMFARGLIQKPKVLVLDESFSKLDLDRLLLVARVCRNFAKEGMTFIIASHDLNFLSEVVDELCILKGGRVIAKGLVADLFTATTLEEIYPSVPLQVVISPESGRLKILY